MLASFISSVRWVIKRSSANADLCLCGRLRGRVVVEGGNVTASSFTVSYAVSDTSSIISAASVESSWWRCGYGSEMMNVDGTADMARVRLVAVDGARVISRMFTHIPVVTIIVLSISTAIPRGFGPMIAMCADE